ncbi:MAG: response regulator, partial [Candidatus Aegiribacteria sp.]|nr:response regulator [Candidatus Aegiribacteria sp.]
MKVLLVDDHQIIRDGLKALIEHEDDMQVVAEAGSGREAIDLAVRLNPDVIVMDVEMGDLNGIEATHAIRNENKDIKVLILSVHYNRKSIANALKAGASGYMLKDCAFEELCSALRQIGEGKTYVSSKTLDVVMEDYVRMLTGDGEIATSPLTPREREVLQLVAEGLHVKGIGRKLSISPKTVESHISNIKNKLDLRSVAELIRYA